MSAVIPSHRSNAGPGTIGYPWKGNLYLNITNRCTLRCRFCPRTHHAWNRHGCNLELAREPSRDEILAAARSPEEYSEVVFSGLGEPSLRLYDALDAGHRLRREGARVRFVTNGLANLVYGRDVTPDFEDNVDVLSVSLIAQDEATYNRHCCPQSPGSYRAMLDFIEHARDFVPSVVVTVNERLPGVDIAECARIAQGLGVELAVRAPGELE